MTGGGGVVVSRVAIVSAMGFVAICCGVLASVTWNVGVVVPGVVGVPLITPVAGSNVKPAGSGGDPAANCHVRAPAPPVAVSVCEYGTFTIPLLSTVVVIPSGRVVIVNVAVAVAICGGLPESATVNVGVAVPSAVGVPLTTPVAGFNVKPNSVPEVNCQA